MLVITIGYVGDSLSSGLSVDSPFSWFHPDTHHGHEDYGVLDAFDEKKQEMLSQLNEMLVRTRYLKTIIPKITIRIQSVARPGINLAHYNPVIDPELVPEQLYGPLYVHSQAANSQVDLAIIALGTNDTQDYNAMTLEIFLNLLDDEEFRLFHDELIKCMPDKSRDILKLTNDMPSRKTNLVSKVLITREDNFEMLRIAKKCDLKSPLAIKFLNEWEKKQYWNKTPDEINFELQRILDHYQKAQHTEQRAYPLALTFILPPNYEGTNIPYPSYHAIGQNIKAIRAQISAFAEKNSIDCYDFNKICELLDAEGQKKYGFDNIHLSSNFYSKLASQFPFADILLKAFAQRVNALLDQVKTKNLYSEEIIGGAKSELQAMLSTMKWNANKLSANNTSVTYSQSHLLLGGTDKAPCEKSNQPNSSIISRFFP